ncbi:MAG: gliding motility protein GldL [Prevotella sp.]|nr:gliding motility protein GldL [Prevotella sp.]
MSQYSKINIIYFMQKWMDSVPGQTFLNYAYSWGAAVVILGTLFKLTHLPGANLMLFIGMGTEVVVFFISAFDRPFDKTTIDMTLSNHMEEEVAADAADVAPSAGAAIIAPSVAGSKASAPAEVSGLSGGTVIIGNGVIGGGAAAPTSAKTPDVAPIAASSDNDEKPEVSQPAGGVIATSVTGAPAPAVSQETADAMEEVTQAYIERLNELNDTLEKVSALSQRLSVDSEEMENLNRTLTGIARVYEMQLKSASQQITTQDSINEQTNIMANKIKELNGIYSRMIEAMTVNMPKM